MCQSATGLTCRLLIKTRLHLQAWFFKRLRTSSLLLVLFHQLNRPWNSLRPLRAYGHKADSNVVYSHLNFKVNVKSGAKLETLAKIAIDQKNAFDIQVILGGICSLTSKQGKVVSYEHRDENLQEIKDNINVLFTKLQRRLLICTIPPANVIISNQYHRVQTASQSEQQQQLEKDILDINKFIGICDSRKTPLIQIDAASQVGSLKKRNHSQKKRVRVKSYEDKHMYDGVCPDSHLKSLWCDKILRGVTTALDDICASSQESSQEEDWGDFKRQRHFWVQVSTHVSITTWPADRQSQG